MTNSTSTKTKRYTRGKNKNRRPSRGVGVSILFYTHSYEYINSHQLYQLVESNPSHMRRVLRQLYDDRYLDKVKNPDTTTPGDKPEIYKIDARGADILELEKGIPRPVVSRSKKDSFVLHTLAIGNFRVCTQLLDRAGVINITNYISDKELRADQYTNKTPYFKEAGRKHGKRPDGYMAIEKEGRSAHFFIEVCNIRTARKVWLSKVKAYENYRLTGESKRTWGTEKFQVICVAFDQAHADTLREATEKAGVRSGYMFISRDNVDIWAAHKLLEPVWSYVGRTGRYSLNQFL